MKISKHTKKRPFKKPRLKKTKSAYANYSPEQRDTGFEPELQKQSSKQTRVESRRDVEPDPNKRKKRVAGRPIPEYYY